MMLVKKNATVTICHTRTVDMPSVAREADIIIVAAGRAGVVGADYVKAGQVVIDVGINVNAEGKLCGDVDYAAVEPIVDAITPVPGGVGSVTTSVLVGRLIFNWFRVNRTMYLKYIMCTSGRKTLQGKNWRVFLLQKTLLKSLLRQKFVLLLQKICFSP